MLRVLVQFAHPALERSRVHRRLLAHLPRREGITLNDLYETYPDFDVDVPREQALLTSHDIIVFQHPFFWYSTPPLLKQWEDLVLAHGWAYGREGRALRGKHVLHVISAGGREEAYQHDGLNRFTMRELLAPLEQTAYLCGMLWAPPYVIHGTHRMMFLSPMRTPLPDSWPNRPQEESKNFRNREEVILNTIARCFTFYSPFFINAKEG